MSNIWSIVRNSPKWKSEQPFNQVGFFLQLDGVKIKDRSNWSCGEPESCYFSKSGEKRTVKLAVWGTKVVLLQDVHHRIAHPRGIPSKAVKLWEGEWTNLVESSSAGRGFFLVRVRRRTKFFDASPNSEQRQKGEQLRENKKRRRREKEGGDC